MKKSYAYILIILAIAVPICTDIIVARLYDSPKLSQEMYESSKGLKVVISDIEARLATLKLKSITLLISALLLGAGVMIIFAEKFKALKTRVEKLEGQLDKNP